MAPKAFLDKSLEVIKEHNSDYRAIAGVAVSGTDGYQAALYYGHNTRTLERDLLLHVASDDPEDTRFEEATIRRSQMDLGEGNIVVDGLSLSVFQGVGSLILQEPFCSV